MEEGPQVANGVWGKSDSCNTMTSGKGLRTGNHLLLHKEYAEGPVWIHPVMRRTWWPAKLVGCYFFSIAQR